MTSKFMVGRRHLRVIPGPSDVAAGDLGLDSAMQEAAAFYDRTITAAWRLAVSLYDHDVRRASDAVVDAYRQVWPTGPAGRHQAALLHALVTSARHGRDPVPA